MKTKNKPSPFTLYLREGWGKAIRTFLLCLFASNTYAQDISIKSSHKDLENSFNWAKNKARSFVVTGQRGPLNVHQRNQPNVKEADYIPSYWAGYPLRTAFYSRDYCHQLTGAHLLGLHRENFTMMKAFAASASKEKKWYPLWAINFDGSPYELDYRGDNDFVREVPAVFELVEKAYKLYCWTGDRRYLEDEVLWNYYTKAVTDFITLHDTQYPNGVAEATGDGDIFKGVATFNEQKDIHLIEAGDGIACQYQAFLAYAEMAGLRGDKKIKQAFVRKAEELKKYFNTDWGIEGTETYNRGYTPERKPITGWGKENSWFMPMKYITDIQSERTSMYLNFINERLESKDDIPENIEALSYIPEIFFQYHRNETGWRWMKYIISAMDQTHSASNLTGKNGNYPEVSYVLISNIVENLAGLSPQIAENKLQTISHLPKEIETLEIKHIPLGNKLVSISHTKRESTHINYEKGNGALKWEVGFPGTYKHLYVDGEKKKCFQRNDNGTICSFYKLDVEPGQHKHISIHPN